MFTMALRPGWGAVGCLLIWSGLVCGALQFVVDQVLWLSMNFCDIDLLYLLHQSSLVAWPPTVAQDIHLCH